ncbi:MAG: hypothetical protein ABII79_05985 [bacterium]
MTCALLLLAAFGLLAGSATAAVTATCEFNETTQSLDYSISGGGAGLIYHISIVDEHGCVYLDAAPELTGPDDAASVAMNCEGGGTAGLKVEICQGVLCFAQYQFRFVCDPSCQIRALGAVPSHSDWSLAGLMLLLLGGGAVVLYRRYATTRI